MGTPRQQITVNGISSLEMTMRDVLAGLEDMFSEYAYQSVPGVFEILAIEPADEPPPPAAAKGPAARVIPLHDTRYRAA